MPVELLKADSINFKSGQVIKPIYQFQRQPPLEGLASYPVNATGGSMFSFQLIPNVINLSKSRLSFTLNVPAQGATNYSWLNVNGLKFFQRIFAKPQEGSPVVDVNYLDRYMDAISRKVHKFADVATYDSPIPYAANPNGTMFEGLIPNATSTALVRLDNTNSVKVTESKYVMSSVTADTALKLDVSIPLSAFKDTLFAVDHDLYWKGSNFTIEFTLNALGAYCWMGTSATNPSTGAAALAVTAGASITNVRMDVAIQQNPDISKGIKETCLSAQGLTLKVPYVYNTQQSNAAGGNNLQAFWNEGQGSHVKKVYWAAYPTTPATPNLIYDKSNLAGVKISDFQTQINGMSVQQQPYIPANGDDFKFIRERLIGSDILSLNEYLYNWCWVDDFTYDKVKYEDRWNDVPKDNFIEGIPLKDKVQYNIISTSGTALTNYLCTVFLKELRISGENITIV